MPAPRLPVPSTPTRSCFDVLCARADRNKPAAEARSVRLVTRYAVGLTFDAPTITLSLMMRSSMVFNVFFLAAAVNMRADVVEQGPKDSQPSGLQAGVARTDITPPVGIAHLNWGSQTHVEAQGIDPAGMYATALVLSDGRTKFAMVDIDLWIVKTNVDCRISILKPQAICSNLSASVSRLIVREPFGSFANGYVSIL